MLFKDLNDDNSLLGDFQIVCNILRSSIAHRLISMYS